MDGIGIHSGHNIKTRLIKNHDLSYECFVFILKSI